MSVRTPDGLKINMFTTIMQYALVNWIQAEIQHQKTILIAIIGKSLILARCYYREHKLKTNAVNICSLQVYDG